MIYLSILPQWKCSWPPSCLWVEAHLLSYLKKWFISPSYPFNKGSTLHLPLLEGSFSPFFIFLKMGYVSSSHLYNKVPSLPPVSVTAVHHYILPHLQYKGSYYTSYLFKKVPIFHYFSIHLTILLWNKVCFFRPNSGTKFHLSILLL